LRKADPTKKKEESRNLPEEDEGETATVVEIKPNWGRIALLGFIISLAMVLLDIIIGAIIISAMAISPLTFMTSQLLQLIVFGEVGLVVLWGGCIGNVGQSVTINKIKLQLFGGRPINKYTFRHATFHAFTYYFAGFLLFVYLVSFIQILKILISVNGGG